MYLTLRFAILLASLSSTLSAGADAQRAETCPGAASWNHENPVAPANDDGAEGLSDPVLLEELRKRVSEDQAARKKWLADQDDARLADAVNVIDAENLAWLRNLISTSGFPTAAQVGNKGVHLAWVLLQHADGDPKLQSDLLPVLEQRFSAGELPANDLARMTDRILMAGDKPQKYGTQFDWFSGEFNLPAPAELAEIDSARAKLGLMPLADYVCTLRQARSAVK